MRTEYWRQYIRGMRLVRNLWDADDGELDARDVSGPMQETDVSNFQNGAFDKRLLALPPLGSYLIHLVYTRSGWLSFTGIGTGTVKRSHP